MTDEDLIYLQATEALRLFRARQLSPVELMKAVIKRIESTEDTINAFTDTYFEQALEQAHEAEARYARDGQSGALDGLPVAIKDETYIKGQRTTFGSLPTRHYIADRTSVINSRILAEGGIVHGRTATPEFSCATYTWSRLHGVTRNPWSPAFTPGGSSGGTGAALAMGTASLGTGSDIAGSIRIPASACGIVGYKPPYGRNPSDPPLNLDFYCHSGPMARSVADLALLQNVMSGPHPDDIATVHPKYLLPGTFESIKGWKIALSVDLGIFRVDPEVRAATTRAADAFRSLGAEVEEVVIDWPPTAIGAATTYLQHLFGGVLVPTLKEHADEMTTYARAFAERGRDSSAVDFAATFDTVNIMASRLLPLFNKYRVLICPTTAIPAVPANYDQSTDRLIIDGAEVEPFLGWVMTWPFNMLSRCPVLSVPSGRASNGVPTGLQIIGSPFRDADVFSAATALEAATGPWFDRSSRRPRLPMAEA